MDGAKFKKMITVCDPDIEVPSRITVSREVQKKKYNYETKIKDHICTIKLDISLTADAWSSRIYK